MGRPINKRNFGTPTADGNEIKVQFHNGTASVPGYIVKQKGSKRFVCKDASGTTATCTLVDKAAGSLAAGEMSITMKLDSTTVVQVIKISGRKMTADNGNTYGWNYSTSTSDGAAQVEEAGDDDELTNATNLEGDTE
jgi:hypothetical protein